MALRSLIVYVCCHIVFYFLAPIQSSTYYVSSNPSANYQCPLGETSCYIYCNSHKVNTNNVYDCNNAQNCYFRCDERSCGKNAIIEATNANNLYITQSDRGDECMHTATVNAPDDGGAYLSTHSDHGFEYMNLYAGSNTQEITIDTTFGENDIWDKEYQGINIYAATAHYLRINIGSNLEWIDGTIQCPVNSPYNGPDIAPCIIDATNGIITNTDITAPDGTPKNVYIEGCGVCSNVQLICDQIDLLNGAESGVSTYPFNSLSDCWWTNNPTVNPTLDPTYDPTIDPTLHPTIDPTFDPTIDPTIDPTLDPTFDPTTDPTIDPTIDPTNHPTTDPTIDPTNNPTNDPTLQPTMPTNAPTMSPTLSPSIHPTLAPTHAPSVAPTQYPSNAPSQYPSNTPSSAPSLAPSLAPSSTSTQPPSNTPSNAPSVSPSITPTSPPTRSPSNTPSISPSIAPSSAPSNPPTNAPTFSPTMNPTYNPTTSPTTTPTVPTLSPTVAPTIAPSLTPTNAPSYPTQAPSHSPTMSPTVSKSNPISKWLSTDTGRSLFIGMIVGMAAICALICVLLVLYGKIKSYEKNSKDDMVHIQCTSDPESDPNALHSDKEHAVAQSGDATNAVEEQESSIEIQMQQMSVQKPSDFLKSAFNTRGHDALKHEPLSSLNEIVLAVESKHPIGVRKSTISLSDDSSDSEDLWEVNVKTDAGANAKDDDKDEESIYHE